MPASSAASAKRQTSQLWLDRRGKKAQARGLKRVILASRAHIEPVSRESGGGRNGEVDSAIWEQTKQELIEAIEQFESDALDADCPDTPEISMSLSCQHGWAAHDREDVDGTMYFVSRQLDGCNGLAKQANGVWMSVCFTPAADDTDAENAEETAGGVD